MMMLSCRLRRVSAKLALFALALTLLMPIIAQALANAKVLPRATVCTAQGLQTIVLGAGPNATDAQVLPPGTPPDAHPGADLCGYCTLTAAGVLPAPGVARVWVHLPPHLGQAHHAERPVYRHRATHGRPRAPPR